MFYIKELLKEIQHSDFTIVYENMGVLGTLGEIYTSDVRYTIKRHMPKYGSSISVTAGKEGNRLHIEGEDSAYLQHMRGTYTFGEPSIFSMYRKVPLEVLKILNSLPELKMLKVTSSLSECRIEYQPLWSDKVTLVTLTVLTDDIIHYTVVEYQAQDLVKGSWEKLHASLTI